MYVLCPQNKNGFCGNVPVSMACLAFITLDSIPRECRRVSVCDCEQECVCVCVSVVGRADFNHDKKNDDRVTYDMTSELCRF